MNIMVFLGNFLKSFFATPNVAPSSLKELVRYWSRKKNLKSCVDPEITNVKDIA